VFYNQTLGVSLGMLPASMGAPWGDAAGKGAFRVLQPAGYTHPLVSIWRDPASGTLSSARFYKGVSLTPLPARRREAGEPVIALAFADGAPAVVERTWDAGRVVEFASTANAAWNDLPAHPAFVPLMQRALGRLVTRRDEALNIPVGSLFKWPAPADWLYKETTVTAPGDAPGHGGHGRVELADSAPLLHWDTIDFAGAYKVRVNTEPPAEMSFAAQMDPAESRLDTLQDADLKTLAVGTQVVHWSPGGDARQSLGWRGGAREFYEALAMLALAVAVFESFMAGRFSAAK
jgi:hypothetical protein